MSTSALDSALSGLRIAQQQLSVISSNISNAQTPGYTRKILPQSTRVIAGEAVGVRADPVIRKVDMFVSRDLWTQTSSTGEYDTRVSYLSKIQDFHGPSESEKSLSAKIAGLKDTFSALSDDPTDAYLLSASVAQAQDVAEKFNEFSDLLTQMRNDAEDDMTQSVDRINALLEQIATQNLQIQKSQNLGQTSANYEDIRDGAVKELSGLMNVTFFVRGDGVMVVQTTGGAQLADENAEELFFKQSTTGPEKYYPATLNGIYLGGDPSTNITALDITDQDLGGKLGALVELRDTTLPEYQAQIDELAYSMATRFESQGLRLFTDENGRLPANTAPIPDPPGPLTPVEYVGFSSKIQVNALIVADPTLLQKGTTGDTIQSGSNEVIRRVLDFTFGTIEYQAVEGTRDIRVSVNPLGDTLQENMGLYSSNTLTSTNNLAVYTTDINAAPGNPYTTTTDDFTMRVYDARTGSDSGIITIDLSAAAAAYPIGSAGVGTGIGTVDNTAEQMASYINSLTWPTDMNVQASVNQYGQMVINTRGNVDIGTGTMGATGLDFLGLTAGTYTTTDPYFDIQVGEDPAVRITIEPGDDQTDLINKIDAVTGIDTADIVLDANGHLSFRPQRGGDIKVSGGPFTSVAGFSTAGGLPILQEIFGAADPVVDHEHSNFLVSNVGPGVNLNTGITSSSSLIDYGQKIINKQTQDQINATSQLNDSEQYRSTLEKTLLDGSGVNVDEELASMIAIQSAYAAAARAITTVNDMFQELLDSVR